jgi:membrane protein YqaA with SNARE-associated domain|tara:strand:+ start:8574 stop:8993 length:420 start_codon:yes stop_codon:yes gene_type:complete
VIYLSLFVVSFLAATILPASSELTLAGLLGTKDYNALALLISASLGNILGSVFNWFLGFYLLQSINKKWLPLNQTQINKASIQFQKFGLWSLLFAWLPIVGDPLTFVAGILKIRFYIFLALVSVGKIARYFFIFYLINI